MISRSGSRLCDTELHREVDGLLVRILKRIFCRTSVVESLTLVHDASAGLESQSQLESIRLDVTPLS
jgi:hypothetical protein